MGLFVDPSQTAPSPHPLPGDIVLTHFTEPTDQHAAAFCGATYGALQPILGFSAGGQPAELLAQLVGWDLLEPDKKVHGGQ